MNVEPITIGPQKGPQTVFSKCPADIAIYGGAAGGGKSWSVLYEALRNSENPYFYGLILRRTLPQITNPGSLWDESKKLYPLANGIPNNSALRWNFPSGFYIKFAGLEHEDSKLGFQGAQIPYIAFDELTHFTESQFWYMQSRNRSESGVSGYVRATTNPDPDSWVRHLIDWWIGPDGFPIPARAGKLRWFIRLDDTIIWADSKKEIFDKYGKTPEILPQSVTFIPAKLEDNKILMQKDPSYKAKLLGMGRVERGRLHSGNWNIRAEAGDYFQESWFEVVDEVPGGWISAIRAWDRAATKPNPSNPNPDWSEGLLLFTYSDGTYCIGDLKSTQDSPGNVKKFMKQTAEMDGQNVRIRAYEDPGSAGKMESEDLVRSFQGYDIECLRVSDKKWVRAKPVSSQAGSNQPGYGGIKVKRAPWNKRLFKQLENFCEDDTRYDHDDIVDALSLAYYFGKVNIANFSDEAVNNFGRLMQGFGRPNG